MQMLLNVVLAMLKKWIAPPDLNDEAAVKAWLIKLLAAAEELSAKTPNTFDDVGVDVLSSLLKSDKGWAMLYKLIKIVASKVPADNVIAAGDEIDLVADPEVADCVADVTAELSEASMPEAIPPMILIEVILVIVKFLLSKE